MAASNKVKYGLKNVYYAPIIIGEDNSITYGTPVHIPGAVSLTLDIQSEEVKFDADDVSYYVSYTSTGYKGTLEMALLPDKFRQDIFGDVEDETDHVMVEYSNVDPKPFALLYEINGDQKATRRLLNYCTVSRPGENATTSGNSRTPQTESMSLTAAPLADGRTRARTTVNTPDTVFNNWFKQVWEPSGNVSALSVAAANNANLERTAAAQGVETMEV